MWRPQLYPFLSLYPPLYLWRGENIMHIIFVSPLSSLKGLSPHSHWVTSDYSFNQEENWIFMFTPNSYGGWGGGWSSTSMELPNYKVLISQYFKRNETEIQCQMFWVLSEKLASNLGLTLPSCVSSSSLTSNSESVSSPERNHHIYSTQKTECPRACQGEGRLVRTLGNCMNSKDNLAGALLPTFYSFFCNVPLDFEKMI